MLHYLLIGFTFAFAAAIQPGPLQAYLVSQALSHGWRRIWPAAFAPLLSDAPIAILALSALHFAAAGLLSVLLEARLELSRALCYIGTPNNRFTIRADQFRPAAWAMWRNDILHR